MRTSLASEAGMGMSLKAEHLKRYKDFAWLLWKYGRGDLVRRAGLSDLMPEVEKDQPDAPSAQAEELAADVERMGPTCIKLGQLLSTRPDIVPPAYAQALARLQDNVTPFSFAEVEKIVADELGVRLSKAFISIDEQPLAAASIAQVHRARLRDGREVVLKVQRPGIRERVADDLEALSDVVRFAEGHTEFGRRFELVQMFDQFRKSLARELDFRQEAIHLLALARNLAESDEVCVPEPVLGYSSSRVLTMEFVGGPKITALSPLARMELDGERLADALFRAYLKQMLRDGLFHADPHPGNVFLVGGSTAGAASAEERQPRIALIDLGMVARITPGLQDRLLQLLLAVADNRTDDAMKVPLLIAESREEANETTFKRKVAEIIGQHQEIAAAQPQ